MSTIPQLRNEMFDYATQLQNLGMWDLAAKIDGWATELYRRSPVRRVVRKQYAQTDRSALRLYADRHPDMNYMEIASAFGCSIGRVSEALAGFRE